MPDFMDLIKPTVGTPNLAVDPKPEPKRDPIEEKEPEKQIQDDKGETEPALEKQEEKENNEVKQAEPPVSPRLFKVKVDGEEKEVSEADLIKKYQTETAAEKRFQDAAKSRKEAEQLHSVAVKAIESIPDNPQDAFIEAYIFKHGGDRNTAYQKWLEVCQEVTVRDYEYKQMPEADRRRLELERENEELKRSFKERQDKEESERREVEESQRMKSHVEGIAAALSARQLPVSEETLDSVVTKMLTLRAAGYDPTHEEAVELYHQDEMERRKRLMGDELKKIPLAEILSIYPELKKHVSEDVLAKAKAQRSSPPKPSAPAAQAPEVIDGKVRRKPLSLSEF